MSTIDTLFNQKADAMQSRHHSFKSEIITIAVYVLSTFTQVHVMLTNSGNAQRIVWSRFLSVSISALLGTMICTFALASTEIKDEVATSKNECKSSEIIPLSSLQVAPELFATHLNQGETLLGAGVPDQALIYFQAARQCAVMAENKKNQIIADSALGNGYLASGKLVEAQNYLDKATQTAAESGHKDLEAINMTHLAHTIARQGNRNKAVTLYQDALDIAERLEDQIISATIKVHLADLLDRDHAIASLKEAFTTSQSVSNPHYRVRLLIKIGRQASHLADNELSYFSLTKANTLAQKHDSNRQVSESYGYLAELYEKADRSEEALQLIAKAIFSAQLSDASYLLMQWEWLQARILDKQGNIVQAVAAYRRAITHFKAIRATIPVTDSDGRSIFRETLEPLLLGFADLLLRQSDTVISAELQQQILLDVQNTIELVKSAELQDYFLDSCAAPQRPLLDLEEISPGTAIIYPIVFNDRLELLYGMGTEVYRKTVKLKKNELEETVKEVVASLRFAAGGQTPYNKKASAKLYTWLIGPLEDTLEDKGLHTLIYLPDGVLRTLPIAALWSEKENSYLIEKYAVSTNPGLTLMDPKPVDRSRLIALLAGVSRPGPVVEKLPSTIINSIAAANSSAGTRGIAFHIKVEGSQADQATPDFEEIKNVLSLPGVKQELELVAQNFSSEQLVNETFLLNNFKSKLSDNFRIVHIASHGFFSGSAADSFIMTYDELLDMNELEAMFKAEAFSDAPVELLILSACQTAQGDDRSPLGLSGIALKSGARSALGTLWPVFDISTQELIPTFYINLTDKKLTKVQALQQAQISLLKNKQFSHPTFWSPFVLVGNWL